MDYIKDHDERTPLEILYGFIKYHYSMISYFLNTRCYCDVKEINGEIAIAYRNPFQYKIDFHNEKIKEFKDAIEKIQFVERI